MAESMTPPKSQTLQRNQQKPYNTQGILDLTVEDAQPINASTESDEQIPSSIQFSNQKRKRILYSPPPPKQIKFVQWKPAEMQQFQPQYPSNLLFDTSPKYHDIQTLNTSTGLTLATTPFFHLAPQTSIATMTPTFPT